ncbi:peroxiredoxin family protein [Oceanicaulis sp. LC35]|uniref:peroxiredoxin family protein n=1 Tax=Oceanicaulis sp. LC35 TaxID=3349635 RepID=UPI003F87ABDA
MLRFVLALSVSLACTLPVSGAWAQSPTQAAAEAASSFGPAIGAPAPELHVVDAQGAPRTLSSLMGEQGLVLYFNRSLDWCPICLRQTLELEGYVDAFADAGWPVAVLTYDPEPVLAQVAERRDLSMALLSDAGSATIDAFGVRDPIYADPDHLAHGVPYPITFVIDRDGVVVAKFWHEAGLGQQRGYATRISAEDVLAAVQSR